jgi:hypothetical protein
VPEPHTHPRGSPAQWARDAIPYVLKEFFGVEGGLYPHTPFNTIRLSLLQGRSMVLGGRAGTSANCR